MPTSKPAPLEEPQVYGVIGRRADVSCPVLHHSTTSLPATMSMPQAKRTEPDFSAVKRISTARLRAFVNSLCRKMPLQIAVRLPGQLSLLFWQSKKSWTKWKHCLPSI